MNATIDGDILPCPATTKEGLAHMLLRYLETYTPEKWGQQVLIRVTDKELFEGSNLEEITLTQEKILFAMKELATVANDLWFEVVRKYTPFDAVLNIPLPNFQDVKLELVNEVYIDDKKGLVSKGYAFQILTKPWVGILHHNGVTIYGEFYVPA
jgi:hypothetical protein